MIPKVSIIIPVYNVGKYIEECILSCINQRVDVEIICVNDGSTDNSQEIIHKYTLEYKNVKEINQPNCGVSVARNVGISHATGDYIMFVDGDDYIHPQSIHILTNYMDNSSVSVVLFDYKRVTDEQKPSEIGEISQQIAIEKYAYEKPFRKLPGEECFGFSCRYIYRREYIQKHELEFIPGMILAEDRAFLYFALAHVSELIHIKLNIYYYRQRPNSIVRNYMGAKRREYATGKIKAAVYYRNYLNQKPLSKEMRTEVEKMVIGHIRGTITLAISSGNLAYCKEIINTLKQLKLYPYKTSIIDTLKSEEDIPKHYALFSVYLPFRYYVYTCCFLCGVVTRLRGKKRN